MSSIQLDGESCGICLGKMHKVRNAIQTKCDHLFHKRCLKQWLDESETCPLCRRVVTKESKASASADGAGASAAAGRSSQLSAWPLGPVRQEQYYVVYTPDSD